MKDDPSGSGMRPTIARALREAPLAIVELDGDLQVIDWNDGAARIFGYSREDAVGRCLTHLLLASGDGDAWRSWLRQGDGGSRLWTHARKDGRTVACAWSRQPLLDDAGEVIGVLCFGQDGTEAPRPLGLQEKLFHAILENLAISVWATDRSGVFTYNDGMGAAAAGIQPGQLVGSNILQMYADHPDVALIRRALEEGEPSHKIVQAAGDFWENWYIPLRDERGGIASLIGVSYDVTEAKRAEVELRAKLDLIEQQQQVIRALSTPIVQVWDGVLTLPMIGVVDSARTAEVMDNLLHSVVTHQARYAILDLTGVDAVDTKTAGYLIELVRAIRLLGAEGIIAGIRPTVAQTIVTLGLDLSGVVTLANLRAALRYCIARMRAQGDASAPAPPSGSG